MSSTRRMPVRLAIVSDFELVVAGVEAILAPHRYRVVVVGLPGQPSLSTGVDVVLWDSSAHPVEDGLDLRWLAGQGAWNWSKPSRRFAMTRVSTAAADRGTGGGTSTG